MESIVNIFSNSLNMKILSSDIVFVTPVKLIMNRCLFGASLPPFRAEWTTFEKGTPMESPFTFF
jgi:hypothetical protein